MIFKRNRRRLIDSTVARIASQLLSEPDINPADFTDETLTAEERLAIYAGLKKMADQLMAESVRLDNIN